MSALVNSDFDRCATARQVARGHDLVGRRVIVTGGSSGIGVETARALAEVGAYVTLAVRDMAAGEKVAAQINGETATHTVAASRLDLADFGSIRAFAERWGDAPLHILINNAGIMACDLSRTEQGLEMQIGVNHFGHSLLTLLMAANLEKAAAEGPRARVVQLGSVGHRQSAMRWEDPHFRTTPYDRWLAYGQSKTANALFAVAFNQRFADRGVNANAVHPGGIRTPLLRHVTPEERLRLGWAPLDQPAPGLKTPEQGAATSVWAALGDELEGVGGLYLEDCAQAVPASADQHRGGVWPWALDVAAADRLWALTLETVGPTVMLR